ncbi:secretion system protein E, partial [Archaeoglobales archaeon]
MRLKILKKPKSKIFEELKKSSRAEWLQEESFRTLAKRLEQDFEIPEEWIQIESYPVSSKYIFVSVHILYREDENEYLYYLNEPKLDFVENEIVKEVINKLEYAPITPEEIKTKTKKELLKEKVDKILDDFRIKLEGSSYYKVFYYILKNTILFDKITGLMFDPQIEDISCNGYNIPIYVFHRKYGNVKTNIFFDDPDELDAFVVKLAQQCGKHISIAEPMVDATMPDGSRIQMTLG